MTNILHRMSRALVLLPVFVVLSCAHTNYYSEPSRPDSQVALLEVNLPLWIVSLDDQPVSYGLTEDLKTLKVVPGPHSIVIQYSGTEARIKREPLQLIPLVQSRRVTGRDRVRLQFVAQAGHTYFTNCGHDEKHWWANIGDFLTVNPK